jgi:1-acyl-sn-glycerol-3-phosphate acyltransferase
VWLWCAGWKLAGDWPDLPKAVIIAAPHTSNWDGLHMLAAAGAWRVTLRWMGKASLAAGPTGPLVRWAGIVPIDRSQSNDVVAAMTAAFADSDAMLLAVPPEGTRSAVPKWKSGFYHIAVAANVPLVFAVLDYGSNTVRLAAAFWPTGDYDADLPVIQAFYKSARGRDPAAFNLGDA